MAQTKDETLRETTAQYLAGINPVSPPDPATLQADLLADVQATFDLENAMRAKNMQWKIPDRLTQSQIADILIHLYPIVKIAYSGTDADKQYDELAMYQSEGEDAGIYVSDQEMFRTLIRQYCYTLSPQGIKDTMALIKDMAPRVVRNSERNLVPVNNGIFDFDTKTLLPFDRSKIFVSKCRVDYNPQATNPIIHNPDDNTYWDVESWMQEISNDPEIVNLLWEILGAIIRPLVPWNKIAWFYAETGNNGKGTLCELMRQLCGKGSYAAIRLADMGKEFYLEPLLHASAIITDENDVGAYIDKAANLKALVTGDAIQINRKFREPVAHQFRGFIVQCMNEMPRIKDKSDSFFRRQLFVPFDKCFTGIERKYIKEDYLKRKDVLEYVLWRVLNMSYYELSEPDACRLALEEYKEYNDPVRQFCTEVLPMAQWDMLPFAMLYDAYRKWFQQNVPSGTVQSKQSFNKDLVEIMRGSDAWDCLEKVVKEDKNASHMGCYEPIVKEYNLIGWMNADYVAGNSAAYNNRYMPAPGQYAQKSFRGVLIRKSVSIQDDATDDVSDPQKCA